MKENTYRMLHQSPNPSEERDESLDIKISIPSSQPSIGLNHIPNDLIAAHIAPYLKSATHKRGRKLIAPELRLISRRFSGMEGKSSIERVSQLKSYEYLQKTTFRMIHKGIEMYDRFSGDDLPGPFIGMSLALILFACSVPVGIVTSFVGLTYDGFRIYQLRNRPKNPNYINYQRTKTILENVDQKNEEHDKENKILKL